MASRTETPDRRDTAGRRLDRTIAAGVLVGLVVLLALVSWNRVTGPFGYSDEGLDSSVWAMCTRAARDDLTGSALGGRRLDGVEYANHPPLTCLAGALSETVAGEHEWATRAPAWIATIALVPLVHLMLRRLRFDPLAAAAGTVVAVGTPMVVTYGPMLDTPVVALPSAAAIAAALAGERPSGDDPPHPWSAGIVALLALLAGVVGWQAGLLALLGGTSLAVTGPDRRRATPYLVGAGAGLALSLGWAAWTYGTLVELTDKLSSRSTTEVGLVESLRFQFDWIRILLGASTLGLLAAVVALSDRALRPMAGLLLTTVLVWSVVLSGGAGGHQFWNYFVVLPTALGGAWVLAGLARWVDHSSLRVPGRFFSLVLAVALATLQTTRPALAERLIDDGMPAGRALSRLEVPAGSTTLHVIGDDVAAYAIVVYYTDLVPRPLDDRAALVALAASDPETPVLVLRPCDDGPSIDLCRQLPDPDSTRSEVASAADLVAQLP